MGSMGFSYDVHEGVIMDEPDAQDRWLDQYGFIPDRFVPVLGQYQAIRDPNYREIVGTTAWARSGVAGLNWMVRWATLGNSQLITASQRRSMVMLGTAVPKTPVSGLLRFASGVSIGILLFDFYAPKTQQSFKMFLSSLNPMNFNPFLA